MKHIHDYKEFLNESGFHGPTNKVTETAKRTKFTGKTAHDLYTQLDGKSKTVFVKNDWYSVDPSELKDDKGEYFTGYTKDGSDYEFHVKDIGFIQESVNEASNSNELELKTYLAKKHPGFKMYPADTGEINVGFLRKDNDYTWDNVMTYYWNTNYDIDECSITKVKI